MSDNTPNAPSVADLQRTPLYALHLELGARMVPFAGYSMPVQYPAGLMAEHHHTRRAAGLFDVSHMGQLRLRGSDAAAALESLMPVDVMGLAVGRQRYGLLLSDEGTILDDLMFFREGPEEFFVVVNGACKVADLAHIQQRIGARCNITHLHDHALLALQGPGAVDALSRLAPGVDRLVFMQGGTFSLALGEQNVRALITRSGYSGEDGFEISIRDDHAEALARALLAQAEVQPVGLGARNSLRLEAGLCLYGNDMDTTTDPVEASLTWAIQKVRRTGGARAGGFPGAARVLAALDAQGPDAAGAVQRRRVGLVALERVPVREHTALQTMDGEVIGQVTSGLLGPTVDKPVALGYVRADLAAVGTRLHAMVRGKPVPMEVTATPFIPNRYFRGPAL